MRRSKQAARLAAEERELLFRLLFRQYAEDDRFGQALEQLFDEQRAALAGVPRHARWSQRDDPRAQPTDAARAYWAAAGAFCARWGLSRLKLGPEELHRWLCHRLPLSPEEQDYVHQLQAAGRPVPPALEARGLAARPALFGTLVRTSVAALGTSRQGQVAGIRVRDGVVTVVTDQDAPLPVTVSYETEWRPALEGLSAARERILAAMPAVIDAALDAAARAAQARGYRFAGNEAERTIYIGWLYRRLAYRESPRTIAASTGNDEITVRAKSGALARKLGITLPRAQK